MILKNLKNRIKTSSAGVIEELSVAYSNKVVDTCRPQPVWCGGKYDVDSDVQCGRSMIEMLGVLAIIGVLSVGGIAGYSKAMDKFKVNKALQQYSMLIYGMLDHIDNFKRRDNGEFVDLLSIANDLELIPHSWKFNNDKYLENRGRKITDDYGNAIQMFYVPNNYGGPGRMTLALYLGGIKSGVSRGFSKSFCVSLLNDLILPLHSNLLWINFEGQKVSYYGDSICTNNKKCIKSMQISDINLLCSYCTRNNICMFYLNF